MIGMAGLLNGCRSDSADVVTDSRSQAQVLTQIQEKDDFMGSGSVSLISWTTTYHYDSPQVAPTPDVVYQHFFKPVDLKWILEIAGTHGVFASTASDPFSSIQIGDPSVTDYINFGDLAQIVFTHDAQGAVTERSGTKADGTLLGTIVYSNSANHRQTVRTNDSGTPSVYTTDETLDAAGNVLESDSTYQVPSMTPHTTRSVYTYDAQENILTITDDGHLDARRSYDSHGSLTSQIVYNSDGSINNQVGYSYTYDASGRMATMSLDSGNNGTIDKKATIAYDTAGNLWTVDFDFNLDGVNDERITRTYDASGHLKKEQTHIFTSQYNLSDNHGNYVVTDSSVSYLYDTTGYLMQIAYDYEGDGQPNYTRTFSYTYALQDQVPAEWAQLSEKVDCEAMTPAYCLGLYGFSVTKEGGWQAGPAPHGSPITGNLTADELSLLSDDVAALMEADLSQPFTCDATYNAIPGMGMTMSLTLVGQSPISIYEYSHWEENASGGSTPSSNCYRGTEEASKKLGQDFGTIMKKYYPRPYPS
jgi:hypothetical protein